jgi:CRP-like cAMP-binding protein
LANHDHPLRQKIERSIRLFPLELDAVQAIPVALKSFARGESIVRQGDRPRHCFTVVDGLAIRDKIVSGDRRQISALCVPGDMPDLQGLFLDELDHNISAVSRCEIALFPHHAILQLLDRFPRIAALFWREILIEAAIYREWLSNVACRGAVSRIACFVSEVAIRLKVAGVSDGHRLPLPLTQGEIGDMLGMSVVHVNRCMRALREQRLVQMQGRNLEILDWPSLRRLGDFDPSYLQLSKADRTGLALD